MPARAFAAFSNTRRPLWLLLFGLLACLAAELLYRGGALDPVDRRVQDFWFQWQGKRLEPRHVAIVAIDEETLAAYPDDPLLFWTDRLATAIGRLRAAGVGAVGLDMLLSMSPERWLAKLGGDLRNAARDYDRAFREQLNSGHLILAATRTGSGALAADYLLPSPDYLLALPGFDLSGHVGLADLADEGDGVVRRYRVAPIAAAERARLDGELPVLSFPALLAVRGAGLDAHATRWLLGGREVWREQPAMPIPYIGPPGSFPRLSLKHLLSADAGRDPVLAALRGKVVLIGATAAGLNDDHFTPYAARAFSGRGALMSGVEVHANILESLLAGERVQPLGEGPRMASLLLLAGIAAFAFAALPAWLGALAWALAAGLLAVFGYAAFRFGVLVPVAIYGAATLILLLCILGWRLTGEERERARVRQMFGRYVSAQVVEALLQPGNRPELGGKAQEITVLFTDIRSFTTISERLSAKEVVEMLNAYLTRACAVLLAEGGSIDKFIGDAIMVEFGAPLSLPDHAVRAARAAVALRGVAEDFSAWMRGRFPGRDLPAFSIGIGLHSGEAVVGNIGTPTRMEFTAIGDTVNLASRLERLTRVWGCAILASGATIKLAGGTVVCGRSDVATVAGREAPVRVFEVLRVDQTDKGRFENA
ncbi:MAG: adenylate/guanylate cyclase domain-containing protein [Betaproteobacteria bacterium]|nr:adenylate/guanylate cyclase domain-containing protein [Betaproteobacteria bacterium]